MTQGSATDRGSTQYDSLLLTQTQTLTLTLTLTLTHYSCQARVKRFLIHLIRSRDPFEVNRGIGTTRVRSSERRRLHALESRHVGVHQHLISKANLLLVNHV